MLDVTVAVQAAAPHVVINWQWPAGGHSNVLLRRREKGQTLPANWQTLAISNETTAYEDFDTLPGKTYDYHLSCIPTGSFRIGTRFTAGYQLPLVESRGKVILLVDNTMAAPLAVELAQWERDAVADGYQVIRRDVPRETIPASSTATADYPKRIAEQSAIRALIKAEYDLDPTAAWHLFIVGHIPVPFSGNLAYDGHADHVGAWPTDVYYSDVDGTWTDSTVNVKAASAGTRTWNVPGDGKFDQIQPPSASELATGRVDLIHMDGVTVGMTETELLRQYFVRNHRFRIHAAPYRTVPRVGSVRDSFEGHGVGGWMNSFSMFGTQPGQSDHMDWFDAQGRARLFAHGSGGGTYLSANGVGTTADFIRKDSKVVFGTMYGSYFGDWGWESRVFLKAPLAGTANSLGLSNSWTPDYLLNHTALGDTIGQGMKLTQSVTDGVWTGYVGLSRTLLGDPTLRLHSIIPPERVRANSGPSAVTLVWNASTDFDIAGYHIYRSTSATGPFTRVSGVSATAANPLGSPVPANTYADSTAQPGVAYTYQVHEVRREVSASGSYANQSQGVAVAITHQAANPVPGRPDGLVVNGAANGAYVLTWNDNAASETAYHVERFNQTTGAWSVIASLAANATTYTDSTSSAGQYRYRVRASGSAGYSAYSDPGADYEMTGLMVLPSSVIVDKTTGSASIPIERFNGSRRSLTLNYATTPVTSDASPGYTSKSGTLAWAHQSAGTQNVSIPVNNLSGNQLTKVFLLNTTPSIQGIQAPFENTAVFVRDPASKHNWENKLMGTPWSFSAMGGFDWASKDGLEAGSVWSQQGYGEHVNGTFGVAGRTGNVKVGAKTDSLAMVHRSVTGNFQFTARVTEMTTEITPEMQVGLMVRNGSASNVVMRSLFLTSKSSLARASRSSVNVATGYADETGAVVSLP